MTTFYFFLCNSRLWKRTGIVGYGPRKPCERKQQSIRAMRSPESRVLRAVRNSFLGHITFKSYDCSDGGLKKKKRTQKTKFVEAHRADWLVRVGIQSWVWLWPLLATLCLGDNWLENCSSLLATSSACVTGCCWSARLSAHAHRASAISFKAQPQGTSWKFSLQDSGFFRFMSTKLAVLSVIVFVTGS